MKKQDKSCMNKDVQRKIVFTSVTYFEKYPQNKVDKMIEVWIGEQREGGREGGMDENIDGYVDG